MAKPTLPVILQIGVTTTEVGTVEIPIVTGGTGKDSAGRWIVDVSVDYGELWRRLADLLRDTADGIEKGSSADA